ncbi:MAG: TRAP transporter substrate-binding protein DctP [Treponema sp.]|jgi:TRAP-type C4-dicarboxylate transport system substrate-binding protein|nr:TRAP transporter substrate-binding protein DctP [Treponema sp.]
MRILNRPTLKLSFLLFLLFFAFNPLFAQRTVTIKLASLVPENTAWGQAINRMAVEWARVTNGEVEVIVYHNGTAGDEGEVLRKLRLNQIQAAIFTSLGINAIMPEVMALSYPFLIRNDAEMEEVLRRLKPEMDARMQQSGFVTLAWARAGWIRLFTRTPVFTPDDLRRIRLCSSPDEQQMIQAFRVMGYQIVPVNMTEIMVSLNSGMVDATYISPIYAAANQLFGIARNMSAINVAPFMGGILMNNTAWRRIPERHRPALMDICRRLEREIEASIANLEAEAINTMVRYGLQINDLSQQQMQVWYNDTARYENNLIGGATPIFHRDYYTRVRNILTEYRRGR